MIDRRSFLKALCAIPIGIALTRFTEAAASFVVELWQGQRLVAVRPVEVTANYVTHEFALSDAEKAAITDWSDLSLRLASNGSAVGVSYAEIDAPMPEWYTRMDRAGQKSYARHQRKLRRRTWRG